MTGFRYITFDCYGTLVDWRKGIGKVLAEAFPGRSPGEEALVAAYIEAEKEQEATYMKYRHVLRSASLCAAERLGADLGQERAAIIADSLPTWPPFPDTAASLRELRERGYSLYILSNVDSDQLLMTIRNC